MSWELPFVLYHNFTDNVPKAVFPEGRELLEILSSFPAPLCDIETCTGKNCKYKKQHPCWSPTVIKEEGKRCNEDVIAVNYIVLDLDRVTDEEKKTLCEKLEGFSAILSSTHSHNTALGSYRLTVELTRSCLAKDFPQVRQEFIRILQIPADPATKDLSRLYALPDSRIGVSPFVRVFEGDPLDVGLLVRSAKEVILPPKEVVASVDLAELRKPLSQARRSKSHGDDYRQWQASLLGRVLDGASLGNPGELHVARRSLCGMLGYHLPANTPWAAVLEILRPCLNATPIAPGTTREETVEKTRLLYENSMQQRLIGDSKRDAENARFREIVERIRGSAPIENAPAQAWRSGSFLTLCEVLEKGHGLDDQALELDELVGCATLGRRPLSDADEDIVRRKIQKQVTVEQDKKGDPKGLEFASTEVHRAVTMIARQHPFNPVHEYLSELVWDSKPRIAVAIEQVFRASPSPVNLAIFRRWFISAAARGMRPGCKCDTMLVLVGKQGVGKSTAFEDLAGAPYFVDTPLDVRTKEAYSKLCGKWIVEWGEVDSIRRADPSAVKNFISSKVDTYRKSYGRHDQDYPRSCVLVGTTNHSDFLVDETGERRFWPVDVGDIDVKLLREWRDQLWAEAVTYYLAGEQWWLTDAEKLLLEDVHAAHRVRDVWEEKVLAWMEKPTETRFGPALVGKELAELPRTTANVLQHALSLPVGSWKPGDEHRVSKILKVAGWSNIRMQDAGQRLRIWTKDIPKPPTFLRSV